MSNRPLFDDDNLPSWLSSGAMPGETSNKPPRVTPEPDSDWSKIDELLSGAVPADAVLPTAQADLDWNQFDAFFSDDPLSKPQQDGTIPLPPPEITPKAPPDTATASPTSGSALPTMKQQSSENPLNRRLGTRETNISAPDAPEPVAVDNLGDLFGSEGAAVLPSSQSLASITDGMSDLASDSDSPAWMLDPMPLEPTPQYSGFFDQPMPSVDSQKAAFDWLDSASDIPDQSSQASAQSSGYDFGEINPAIKRRTGLSRSVNPANNIVGDDGSVDINALLNLGGDSGEMNDSLPPVPDSGANLAQLAKSDFDLDDMDLLVAAPMMEPVLKRPSAPVPVEPPPSRILPSFQDDIAESGVFALDSDNAPMPDGLRSLAGTSITAPQVARDPMVPFTPVEDDAYRDFGTNADELPEWIADMRPEEAQIPLSVGDQVVRMKEAPLARVPEALRNLRERSKLLKPEERRAPLEGPLAGIAGAISAAPAANTSESPAMKKAATAFRRPINDTFSSRVKILQNMLRDEETILERRELDEQAREKLEDEEASAVLERIRALPAPRQLRFQVFRLVTVAVVLVAILLPLLTAFSPFISLQDSTVKVALPASGLVQVSQQVSAITPGQLVLIAFEYAPSAAAEMDQLAKALVLDLLGRGARPVLISSNPSAALHAYGLMDQLSRQQATLDAARVTTPLQPRINYYVLRYIAGGSVGLRGAVEALFSATIATTAFSTDIEGQATQLSLDDLATMRTSPVFLLAESTEDVRTWAEQYRIGQTATVTAPLRLVLLVSTSASVAAQSYVTQLDTRSVTGTQIIGPLAGARGAAEYRLLRNLNSPAEAARAERRWQATGFSTLLAGVIILVGMIINIIRSIGQSRRAKV